VEHAGFAATFDKANDYALASGSAPAAFGWRRCILVPLNGGFALPAIEFVGFNNLACAAKRTCGCNVLFHRLRGFMLDQVRA
jgi:hypothetical protein